MVIIELKSQGPSLKLEVAIDGWCRVTLFTEPSCYLGADCFDVVRARICNAIEKGENLDYRYRLGDAPVAWVAALGEKHTSIYVSRSKAWLTFHLQDEEACWFAQLELSESECTRWIKRLAPIPANRRIDA
jgi:hypothetical protein